MIEQLHLDALPLVRSGGVFLIIVGIAIMLGALRFRARYLILGLGAAAGGLALAVLAVPLSAPYGPPSAFQIATLATAITLEILAFVVLMPRTARRGERAMIATILAIVGAHFLIMTPAFGPLIFALGVANLINALIGARWSGYPLPAFWAADGVLKAAFGVAMYLTR